jgi:hypothetical protein
VLRERDVRDARLPEELRAALREWSDVAETVLRSGDVHELDLLRRRGRQLASRAAQALGRPVEFVDPVSGAVESIRTRAVGPGTGARSPGTVAAPSGSRSNGSATHGSLWIGAASKGSGAGPNGSGPNGSGSNGSASNGSGPNGAGSTSSGSNGPGPALALEPAGPTPWGTGMAVAAFFAVLVAIADVVLAGAFASAFGLLWVPANLLVTAGTMPSLWLAREVPFWRWPAFGAAAGIVAAWVVMLLGLLAP